MDELVKNFTKSLRAVLSGDKVALSVLKSLSEFL